MGRKGMRKEKQREGSAVKAVAPVLSAAGSLWNDSVWGCDRTVNLGVVCLCICTCSHFGVAAVVWMLTVSLKSPCERKAHLQDDAIGTLWKPRRECVVGGP